MRYLFAVVSACVAVAFVCFTVISAADSAPTTPATHGTAEKVVGAQPKQQAKCYREARADAAEKPCQERSAR